MRSVAAVAILLILSSCANATVIDVITDGLGTNGHAGTIENPLVPGDWIYIDIVLNHNPYPGYPSYDGYALDAMDLSLHVSGPGTLNVIQMYDKGGYYPDYLLHHTDFDVWDQSGYMDGTYQGYEPLIVDNSIDKLIGGTFGYILGSNPPDGNGPPPSPTKLVWNLFIECEDYGQIHIDLALRGTTHYWDYSNPAGRPYGEAKYAVEDNLGDLVLYSIPEPMTICLLGLGGLFFVRKRQ